MTIHEKHLQWIEDRGISGDLAILFGLETTRDHQGQPWLTVPYRERGEVVNHKYRMTHDKRHRMDADAPLLLWNVDCLSHPEVLAGASVVITEGEWDALATMTAGLNHVVSVPNGAPARVTDEPEKAQRYAWVWRHLAELDRVKSFVLATDGDQAGYNLAADLVALLGADRCRFVTYPPGCKDLNEVVMKFGTAVVVEIINGAKPYPVKGLFRISDFPPEAEPLAYPTGIPALNDLMMIVPGTLTVFTGWANIGKSTVLSSIIASQIENGRPVCVAPFETDIRILKDSIRQAMMKCSTYEMQKSDTSIVDQILEDNLVVIYQDVNDEDEEMDLERFLELCRIAVLRHGVRMVVLDPWNELEHKRRRDETEAEYTNRALRAMRQFAKRHMVSMWVVAHPGKPEKGFNGVPKLYQVSGSAAWANKPHYGLTYHRKDPTKNAAELHVTKVKQGLPGMKGSVKVSLDFRTWQFVLDLASEDA